MIRFPEKLQQSGFEWKVESKHNNKPILKYCSYCFILTWFESQVSVLNIHGNDSFIHSLFIYIFQSDWCTQICYRDKSCLSSCIKDVWLLFAWKDVNTSFSLLLLRKHNVRKTNHMALLPINIYFWHVGSTRNPL